MHAFEITVQRRMGDGWPVVAEQSTSGVFLPVRHEGVLRLDVTELASQTTPKEYGLVLGRALFRDEVRDAFVQALAKSEDYLRVLLFVEADDLKTLRWERLCAPLEGGWDFLALSQRAPFCLYLPSLTDRRFPPFGRRDLRALVLVASPDGLERYRLQPFDVKAAVTNVRAALGDIPCDMLAGVEGAVGPPTLDTLCERITAEPYTLLHVVCHGQFMRESGETVLYWDTADHGVDPVAGARLLERLGRLQGARGLPHFAFLATCESARAEAEGALGGVGQRLVRELGMPAVVAMTETVSVTTAQALGTAFYGRLREHGEVDRALVEACAGLAERYDITVPALYSRLGGRPLFSDTPDRPLTHAEIGFGLDRLETLLAERAPVLREIFQTQAVHLRSTLGADVNALSVDARQEHEQALTEVNKLCGEALDLSFDALALGQEPPAYDGRCPFRGLYPFRQEDREFFFGREALIEHLRQKLADHPFLAVLGPSGSGKSSLVLAGLLPALQAQEPELQMAYLTPGANPLTQLEASLTSVHDGRAVVVVDQFEELFTLCPDQSARQAFLGRLLAVAEQRRMVITMRADFWGECAPYHDLKDIMQAHQELIAPMDATELRRAMELQAAKVGLRFEADLSQTILDDVQGEPGAMPLLQHALLELWKRRHGRWLRAEEYRAIGGVQQAMARTADDLYEQLSSGEQDRVRDIFMRLTRLDDDAVSGEARRDTRRRVGLQELVPAASDPTLIRALVNRLADSRLVVTSRNEAAGREEVEVAHEALIRYWPRLRSWLDEDRASLRLRETVRQAALEWEAGGRDDSLLVHRGGRLRDAEALARPPRFTLNELEQAYVDACVGLRERLRTQEEEQRQRELEAARQLAAEAEARRGAEEKARQEAEQRAEEQTRSTRRLRKQRRWLWGVLVMLAVITLCAALSQQIAARERRRAEKEARLAASRQLAAQALTHVDNHLDLALLLGVESYNAADTVEARGSLLTGLQHRPHLAALLRSESGVSGVAFSADGRSLASVSATGTILLWDVATRRPLRPPLTGPYTFQAAFSLDGRLLATQDQQRVLLWDVIEGQRLDPPLTAFEPGAGRVESIAFGPDGRLLAIGGCRWTEDRRHCKHGEIRLWDTAAGQWLDTPLQGHSDAVSSLVFGPDGQTLVSASTEDNSVILWRASAPEPHRLSLPEGTDTVRVLAFSPDGQTLALLSGAKVMLWNVVTSSPVGSSPIEYSGGVSSAAFSPDGRWLASGNNDNTIILWDVTTQKPRAPTLFGHTHPVSSLVFSPDGQWLASGSKDGTTILWDLRTPLSLGQSLRAHQQRVSGVAFSPDGRTLASSSWDRTVKLWDLTKDRPIDDLLNDSPVVASSPAFSPDGRWLATGSENQTVILWDLGTRRPLDPPLQVHTRWQQQVNSVAFSPDGKRLAWGSQDGTIVLWDVVNRRLLVPPLTRSAYRGQAVDGVAFSPDGKRLAAAGSSQHTRLWDAVTGKPLTVQLQGSGGSGVAFSADGKWLAATSADGFRLWETVTFRSLGSSLISHGASVTNIAFSPDGWVLASGADTAVRLWGVTPSQPIGRPLTGHGKEVTSVAFSLDGKRLASADASGLIILWDIHPQSWQARACHKAGRNLSFEEWGQFMGETEYRATCSELPIHPSLMEAGKNLARSGNVARAVAIVQRVQALEPVGDLDAHAEAKKLAAPNLLAEGKQLARDGDVAGAAALFRRAQEWDSDLKLDPQGMAARELFDKAQQTASDGDVTTAVALYRKALELDPKYARDFEAEAIQSAVNGLVTQGQQLASAGDVEGAVALFQRARGLDPNSRRGRETEENQSVAEGLRARGQQLALAGDVEGAVVLFQQAQTLDPDSKRDAKLKAQELAAEGMLAKGEWLVSHGKVREAVAAYAGAQALDAHLKIPPRTWNTLCWSGSLWGQAVDVMGACEQAVALDPDDGGIRDSRGLARALTGDIRGATEDFQAFVGWTKDQALRAQRQRWLATLRAGQNPFTPDVILRLRRAERED